MSYALTIEPLGQTIEIEEGQTILDAALRAGIYLPHACCHGLCATCKVQVADGEVEHGEASSFALMDFERDEGKCLACCATPQGDLVIEAEIDEDPDAENLPVQDYDGTVTRIETLTPTIKGVWIRLDAPIRFQAGQYVNLELPGGIGSRAFSIASPPSVSGEVELNIRIVPGGHHRPLRAFLREEVGPCAGALHGRRVGSVQPPIDDPGLAGGRFRPTHHPGVRPAQSGRALFPRRLRGPGGAAPQLPLRAGPVP